MTTATQDFELLDAAGLSREDVDRFWAEGYCTVLTPVAEPGVYEMSGYLPGRDERLAILVRLL